MVLYWLLERTMICISFQHSDECNLPRDCRWYLSPSVNVYHYSFWRFCSQSTTQSLAPLLRFSLRGKTWQPLYRHCTQNVTVFWSVEAASSIKLLRSIDIQPWAYKNATVWLKMVCIFCSPTYSQNFHFFTFQPQNTSLSWNHCTVKMW